MLNVPLPSALHLFEELTVKNMVVGVVARMPSGSLIELRRRVASPNRCIFLLRNLKCVWKAEVSFDANIRKQLETAKCTSHAKETM